MHSFKCDNACAFFSASCCIPSALVVLYNHLASVRFLYSLLGNV